MTATAEGGGAGQRPTPITLTGLSDIAGRYDALLCDVWGVIHNGREAFAPPCAALARWIRECGPVVLISNSPRPSADVARQLRDLGVPRDAWSALVTSGDATRALLAARAPGPAWRIGPERDEALYDGLGLSFAGPDEAAFICCTGLVDDERETPEDYRAVLTAAARRGLGMICANPDRVVQRGDRLIWCAGALAALYEQLGGTVNMAGKPHRPIYRLALAAASAAGRQPKRLLAVGDGVATDVVGANGCGLDVLFITGGIHSASAGEPDSIAALLAEHDAWADFAMGELAWG